MDRAEVEAVVAAATGGWGWPGLGAACAASTPEVGAPVGIQSLARSRLPSASGCSMRTVRECVTRTVRLDPERLVSETRLGRV